MRDHRQATSKRDGRNLEIVRANALPSPLESMTNASAVTRLIVERQRKKRFQEPLDDSVLVDGIAASLRAEQELRPHDRAERHVVGALRAKTGDDRRGLSPETRNARIRVEQIFHGSGNTRDSSSGCGARSKVGSWIAPSMASNHPSGHVRSETSRTVSSTRCPTSGASSGSSSVAELRTV